MNKNKSNTNTTKVPSMPAGIPKIFRIEEMTVYSELVRIIGEQNHSYYPRDSKFYWTLALEDNEFVEIEIILTSLPDEIILEIYEVEPERQASKKVNYDLIYTLMGYACSKQIELKHNSYLHIEGKSA